MINILLIFMNSKEAVFLKRTGRNSEQFIYLKSPLYQICEKSMISVFHQGFLLFIYFFNCFFSVVVKSKSWLQNSFFLPLPFFLLQELTLDVWSFRSSASVPADSCMFQEMAAWYLKFPPIWNLQARATPICCFLYFPYFC